MTDIVENGKRYRLDGNGIVVEASAVEEPQTTDPIGLNDRVEVDGRLGTVVFVSPWETVYGSVVGVRFDDNTLEEVLAESVKLTNVERPDYDSPLDEVKAEWDEYQKLPAYTLEELDKKAALARRLNLTAKALVTDKNTGLSDQILLDQIVVTTGTELYDMKEKASALEVKEAAVEPKVRLPEVGVSQGMSRGGDASWLETAADEMHAQSLHFNWDQELTNIAVSSVSQFDVTELENDKLMERAREFAMAKLPMGVDDEKIAKFEELFQAARSQALSDRRAKMAAKEASSAGEEAISLEDFDPAQLYM